MIEWGKMLQQYLSKNLFWSTIIEHWHGISWNSLRDIELVCQDIPHNGTLSPCAHLGWSRWNSAASRSCSSASLMRFFSASDQLKFLSVVGCGCPLVEKGHLVYWFLYEKSKISTNSLDYHRYSSQVIA